MLESRDRRNPQLLIFLVDDVGEVRGVRSAVALGSNVEWLFGILREPVEEEFQECVDIFTCNRAGIDRSTVISVRVTNIDRLIEEDDVGMAIPAVGVACGVLSVVGDVAWPEFE